MNLYYECRSIMILCFQHAIKEAQGTEPKYSIFTHSVDNAGKLVSVKVMRWEQILFIYVPYLKLSRLSKEW